MQDFWETTGKLYVHSIELICAIESFVFAGLIAMWLMLLVYSFEAAHIYKCSLISYLDRGVVRFPFRRRRAARSCRHPFAYKVFAEVSKWLIWLFLIMGFMVARQIYTALALTVNPTSAVQVLFLTGAAVVRAAIAFCAYIAVFARTEAKKNRDNFVMRQNDVQED